MQHAPGQKLLAVARRILSRAEIDRVIEPAIADLQHEWSASGQSAVGTRLAIRARAYVAALFVVGRHVLVGAARASLSPPPWSLTKRILGPSAFFLAIVVGLKAFVFPPRGTDKDWLFFLPDWLFYQAAFMPYFWASLFQRRPLETGDVPVARAIDIAKLTVAATVLGLMWTGWIAPLLRQQYLVNIGLVEWMTSGPHQWLLPDLIATVTSGSAEMPIAFELHRRLLFVALTPITGVVTWAVLVRGRGKLSNRTAGFQLLSAVVLMTIGMLMATALTSIVGRIAGEWLGLGLMAIGARATVKIAHEAARRDMAAEVEA